MWASSVLSKLTFNILFSFLTQQLLFRDIHSDTSLKVMLFHFHWDYGLVCEMLQQNLHFPQKCERSWPEQAKAENSPLKAAHSSRGQHGCLWQGLSPGPRLFLSIRSKCIGRSTPSQVIGALLPHLTLNKRPCRSLLCLAESRRSINICWMSPITLMKRDPFVFLGHWICHLLNGLWLPGLTNL